MTRASLRNALCAAVAAIALLGVTPKAQLPKVPLHTEYVVAVNKLGQVTHVLSGKTSKNKTYDLQTYGNALQAYIRTPDGRAIPGRYRLIYDYNPKTARIRRTVALISAGGVDPDALGAVNVMFEDVEKHAKAAMTPGPQPSGNLHLPDLEQITKTPPP